jgi:hypothetical protein
MAPAALLGAHTAPTAASRAASQRATTAKIDSSPLLHRPVVPSLLRSRLAPSAAANAAAAPQRRRARPIPTARAAAPSADPAPSSPPTRGAGRMTYYPSSYTELVGDAAAAVDAALTDGLKRVEVEFPPVPTGLDAYKGSSDLFIDSNVQLALSAAKMLAGIVPLPGGGGAQALSSSSSSSSPQPQQQPQRNIHIVVPDLGEYARSYKLFKPALDALGGRITMGHLKEADPGGGVNPFDLVAAASAALAGAGAAPDPAPAGAAADVLVVVNATCTDLPALENYVKARRVLRNEDTSGSSSASSSSNGPALVCWNLELDTLRGDLGLLGYPPKALHHRFLSTVRPAFFLRARDYSKSVPVAPFIVNYSGALLREWPGPWQVMLRQDGGEYACIAEDKVRYNLGELKDELTAAMGLDTEAAGSVAALLRRGYKTSTWFEDDAENEESREWRL